MLCARTDKHSQTSKVTPMTCADNDNAGAAATVAGNTACWGEWRT